MGDDTGNGDQAGRRHPSVHAAYVAGYFVIAAAVIQVGIQYGPDVYDRYFASEEVTYNLEYSNTGSIEQRGVSIKVVLPDGVEYIPDSTYYADAGTNNKWRQLEANSIAGSGLSIDRTPPQSRMFIQFKAKLSGKGANACSPNGVAVSVTAISGKKSTSAQSTIEIEAKCE